MNGDVGTFEKTVNEVPPFAEFVEMFSPANSNLQALRREYDLLRRATVYCSDHYTVDIDKTPEHGYSGMVIWRLSIKRNDREPIMDWRDLQAIKSQLCGEDAEAIQLFPAEQRVVDTANQYHLFVFMKGAGQRFPRVPVGWTTGEKSGFDLGRAKQRAMTYARD